MSHKSWVMSHTTYATHHVESWVTGVAHKSRSNSVVMTRTWVTVLIKISGHDSHVSHTTQKWVTRLTNNSHDCHLTHVSTSWITSRDLIHWSRLTNESHDSRMSHKNLKNEGFQKRLIRRAHLILVTHPWVVIRRAHLTDMYSKTKWYMPFQKRGISKATHSYHFVFEYERVEWVFCL